MRQPWRNPDLLPAKLDSVPLNLCPNDLLYWQKINIWRQKPVNSG